MGDILQDWQLYGDVPAGWEKHRIQALKPYKWFLPQDLKIYRISFGLRQLLGRPCPPPPHWGDILQAWQLYGDIPPHWEHIGMRE